MRKHGIARLGIFYFCLADDSVQLTPLDGLPEGGRSTYAVPPTADGRPLTMYAWRTARIGLYGQTNLTAVAKETEEEVVAGVLVRHFN